MEFVGTWPIVAEDDNVDVTFVVILDWCGKFVVCGVDVLWCFIIVVGLFVTVVLFVVNVVVIVVGVVVFIEVVVLTVNV